VAAARRATAHLGGWRRLAAGAWHAVREQLASCAVAEAVGLGPPAGHQGWLLLVKWVSVSMSSAL